MTAQELEIIHADLLVAKNILYPTNVDNGAQNNPQLNNLAAYLSAQAIEKSLKAIVRDGGEINAELSTSHNVVNLLLGVEMCKPNFIHEHQFIAQNAQNLSKVNGLRYGKKRIEKKDVVAIYKAARGLHRDLLQEYLKDNPDKQQMFNEAVREYEAMDKISFKKNTPSEEWGRE